MRKKRTLTYNAGLTFLSQILQMLARLIVSFSVTPIVIRGLGAELYGAWSMIQQSLGYLSLSDLRPMGTLKFTLATKQHINDPDEKKRQIGAALRVWVISFPIFCILGVIAIWKVPLFIHVKPQYLISVQIAIAILVFCAAMEKLFSLPANVLRGLNLEYKAMGLNSAIILINGGIVIFVIKEGWGLPGVASASFLGIFISGLVRLWVARNAITWFGSLKPTKSEFLNFMKFTGWLTLSAVGGMLFSASDLILIGYVLSPAMVTVYVTTGTVLIMATTQVIQLLGSANAGLVGIIGKGDWERAIVVRTELFTLGISALIAIGTMVLALNKSFISLWVGPQFFGGQIVTVLLVAVAICKLFFQIDSIVLAGVFETRIKHVSLSLLIVGCFTIINSLILLKICGIAGMAIGTCFGYLSQWLYYQIIIHKHSKIALKIVCKPFIKILFSSFPIFLIAIMTNRVIHVTNWISFSAVVLIAIPLTFTYIWFLVVGAQEKKIFKLRIKSLFAIS